QSVIDDRKRQVRELRGQQRPPDEPVTLVGGNVAEIAEPNAPVIVRARFAFAQIRNAVLDGDDILRYAVAAIHLLEGRRDGKHALGARKRRMQANGATYAAVRLRAGFLEALYRARRLIRGNLAL